MTQFTDFSQMLYWFVSSSRMGDIPGNEELEPPFEVVAKAPEDGTERFDVGDMVCFSTHRKSDAETEIFNMTAGDELPSIALNQEPEEGVEDVCERGRLKFSADALDFFSDEGEAGISASRRLKGVVLHDILSRVSVPADLAAAVRQSVRNGDITVQEAQEAESLLEARLAAAVSRGWFPEKADMVLNESTLIDTDGQMLRPDRVVVNNGRVVIIDYKFGEHHRSYERQLRKYAGIWRRLGYSDVSSFLWYVHTDEAIEVV
jgi:hypothetical protein